jgi:hypothetical protein
MTKKIRLDALWRWGIVLPLLAGMLLTLMSPALAQEKAGGATPLHVAVGAHGVELTWSRPLDAVTAADLSAALPTAYYQGYTLPLETVALRFPSQEAAQPVQITQLEAEALAADAIAPSDPPLPPVLEYEGMPDLTLDVEPKLPEAPVFVLRQGYFKGEYLVVLGVSPIYQEDGVVKMAASFAASAPGATTAPDDLLAYLDERNSAQAAQNASPEADVIGVPPTNPDAATALAKIRVSKPGIQRILRSTLETIDPALVQDLNRLRLRHKGVEVALQVVGTSEIRFFVGEVGDRWNKESVFYLSVADDASGLQRILQRVVTPINSAGAPSTVAQNGKWSRNTRYESFYPGADEDHWYVADLKSSPTDAPLPGEEVPEKDTNSITANFVLAKEVNEEVWPIHSLPLAAGTSTFTYTITPYRANRVASLADYTIRVRTSDGSTTLHDFQVRDPSDPNDWDKKRWLPFYSYVFTTSAKPESVTITLMPEDYLAGLKFDTIRWERPVTLNFASKGAFFKGRAGQSSFTWQGAPNDPLGKFGVYDVTTPTQPTQIIGSGNFGFIDALAGRSYVLIGDTTLWQPSVEKHTPVTFSKGGAAHAIYIVPDSAFASALQPLLTLRQSQGYLTTVVDVRKIYDAWSYGYVSAEAVRSFLQFAYVNWNPQPISVVLVGDATWDPKNYEIKDQHTVLVPAYMIEVDPWLGEAACDNCFGQLHGIDPHTGDDPNGLMFGMELAVGRFPVKSVDELNAVVGKIVSYESQTDMTALWRSRSVYVADNYLKSNPGGPPIKDGAGNFAEISNQLLGLNPLQHSQDMSERVYYDPFPELQTPPATNLPWHISDAAAVRSRAISALAAGPGLFVYNGHANHWNMASTEQQTPNEAILKLYDELQLNNYNQLFIQLSMTCLTSQFVKPANAGTTFDERLFLHPNGGSVAVWGPAGLSVVHGHDKLQHGFFTALFGAAPRSKTMAELIEAGHTDLALHAIGTEDVLRTFLLFGDPLTRPAIVPGTATYLPTIAR